jgi:hypothetical protein
MTSKGKTWGKTSHLKQEVFALFRGENSQERKWTFHEVKNLYPEIAPQTLRSWYQVATKNKSVTPNPPLNWKLGTAQWYKQQFEKKKEARLKGLALAFGLNYKDVIEMTNNTDFNDLTKFEKTSAILDFVAMNPSSTNAERLKAAQIYLDAIRIESKVPREIIEERKKKEKEIEPIVIEDVPLEEKYRFFRDALKQ